MRKTRLVILPTKCLHQMGFLLLFLSCPVIGDWGRIRPDNENLQRAIEVEREGTCGLQRDTPGGFPGFMNEKGSDIRRFREDNDLSTRRLSRFDERRNVRKLPENDERRNMRRLSRNDDRRERSVDSRLERQERSIRRNDESRRNDVRVRSLSLSRLEATRRQSREFDTERSERRLSLARRESERRIDQRDAERTNTMQNERTRSVQRRENDRSVQRLSLQRREDEMRRNVREESGRRLSLSRVEEDLRRTQRSESRRSADRVTLDRRLPEIRKTRNDVRNEREREVNAPRELETRTLAKRSVENVREERRMGRIERMEKTRRVSAPMKYQDVYYEDKEDSFFTGAMKWLNFENYETPTIGDWSSNCVIGAVAYYLSTRQTKTV